jgi:hypothetical protein
LVVEGVGGEDAVDVTRGQEGGEEVIADGSGGFFDGFAGFGDACGDVDVMEMEGNFEVDAEVFDELSVSVGFGTAEAVMDVDGGETDAESVAFGVICGVESEEESYGVGSAGDGGADAVAGADVFAREGEAGGLGHQTILAGAPRV